MNSKAKRYGKKLASPRIRASKEHRSRGALGYKTRIGKDAFWHSREYAIAHQ